MLGDKTGSLHKLPQLLLGTSDLSVWYHNRNRPFQPREVTCSLSAGWRLALWPQRGYQYRGSAPEVSEGCVPPIRPLVVPSGINPSAAFLQEIDGLRLAQAIFHHPKVGFGLL
jgi:hypothetical protein